MKKIMMLGGSASQVPAIKRAKEMGYYVVLCDYLPNNPGRKYADVWYDASTIDYKAVLEIAKKEKIHGIMCYCSDIAASTVAYVAEKLHLPGSPYESVYTLTHKDKFREFLRDNGFNVPESKGFFENELEKAKEFAKQIGFPLIVKPVDSQGGRGVTKITEYNQIDNAIKIALSQSLGKKIIIEQYISTSEMQIDGEMFTVDGKIENITFLNDYFMKDAQLENIPIGEIYPAITETRILDAVRNELQRAVTLLNMGTQAYNTETKIDANGNVYIIEIGPRNGGNIIPIINEKATGFDELSMSIAAAVGDPMPKCEDIKTAYYWGIRALYSKKAGKLKELWIDEGFKKKHLVYIEEYVNVGENVRSMEGLNSTIAMIGAKFETLEELMRFEEHPEDFCRVEI